MSPALVFMVNILVDSMLKALMFVVISLSLFLYTYHSLLRRFLSGGYSSTGIL